MPAVVFQGEGIEGPDAAHDAFRHILSHSINVPGWTRVGADQPGDVVQPSHQEGVNRKGVGHVAPFPAFLQGRDGGSGSCLHINVERDIHLVPTLQVLDPVESGGGEDDSLPGPVVNRVGVVTEIAVREVLPILGHFLVVEGGGGVHVSDVQGLAAATAYQAGGVLGQATHGLRHLSAVAGRHLDLQGY